MAKGVKTRNIDSFRVQLIEYHDKYMKLGEIPSYAYQNFCEMYDAYHALGGNGMVRSQRMTKAIQQQSHSQKNHEPIEKSRSGWL